MPKAPEAAPETTDGPLLDMSDAAVKRMIKLAKQRGYVTYDELNDVLPSEEVSSEQIEDTMAMLSDMGINVIETDEAEEADGLDAAALREGVGILLRTLYPAAFLGRLAAGESPAADSLYAVLETMQVDLEAPDLGELSGRGIPHELFGGVAEGVMAVDAAGSASYHQENRLPDDRVMVLQFERISGTTLPEPEWLPAERLQYKPLKDPRTGQRRDVLVGRVRRILGARAGEDDGAVGRPAGRDARPALRPGRRHRPRPPCPLATVGRHSRQVDARLERDLPRSRRCRCRRGHAEPQPRAAALG